jgi:hypothetical protein
MTEAMMRHRQEGHRLHNIPSDRLPVEERDGPPSHEELADLGGNGPLPFALPAVQKRLHGSIGQQLPYFSFASCRFQ